MALLDKLNVLAAAATDKANSAIETGKLTYKVSAEEKKIADFTLAIGDLRHRQRHTRQPFGRNGNLGDRRM